MRHTVLSSPIRLFKPRARTRDVENVRNGFHCVNVGEGVAPVLDAFSVAAE